MTTVSVTMLRKRMFELLDSMGAEGLIVTKYGRPVARLVPMPVDSRDLIGSLRDKLQIHGDIVSISSCRAGRIASK